MSMSYTALLAIVNVKTKSKFEATDIMLALEEVEQAIKNYCNIAEVPKALYFTWANMAIDLLSYNYETNRASDTMPVASVPVDVTEVKMGDTTFKMGDGPNQDPRTKALRSHMPNLDDIVMNYRQQLNLFRRIW